MTIQIGTRVRSFDFANKRSLEGDQACYAEGEVVGFEIFHGSTRYVIEVDRCIFAGEEVIDYPVTIYPPVNGTPTWMGSVTNSVEAVC